MDRFTRRYLITLAVLGGLGGGVWYLSGDRQARRLNRVLARDPRLAEYPYRFRVLSVDHGVATLTTPRNVDVPGPRFLAVAFPELADLPPEHPRMQAAMTELKALQEYAAAVVEADPEVSRVHWSLDEAWLSRRGIVVPP